MAGTEISYIDINEVIRGIKDKNKLITFDEISEILKTNFSEGKIIKDKSVGIIETKFFNPLAGRDVCLYYFACPKCGKKARKLYIMPGREVVCRICSKIRNKNRVNTNTDRVLKIQKYMHEIFNNKELSNSQKNRMASDIQKHYDALPQKYKIGQTSFIIKNVQVMCSILLQDKSKTPDYKKAIKDVMSLIKTSKLIIAKTTREDF